MVDEGPLDDESDEDSLGSVAPPAASQGYDILFESDDLLVRWRIHEGERDRIVVTFSGLGTKRGTRTGAGEGFLAKYGQPAVHFISQANIWWQSPSFDEALRRTRAFASERGFRRIVTMGSSMGGYGALAASGELGAAAVVAIAPQYTIDPAVVPWETRWAKHGRRITFMLQDMRERLGEGRIYTLVDPLFAPDMAHVRMIQALRPVSIVPVSFSEHDVSPALLECGLLSRTILDCLTERIDVPGFVRELRTARRTSAIVLGGVARRQEARGRRSTALDAGRRAFELALASAARHSLPALDRAVEGYAQLLAEAGRHDEVVDVLRRWEEATGSSPYWLSLQRGRSLEAIGRQAEALLAYLRAARTAPSSRQALSGAARLLSTPSEALLFDGEFRERCLASPGPFVHLSRSLFRLGLEKEARTVAKLGVERWPDRVGKLKDLLRRPDPAPASTRRAGESA